MMCLIHCFLCLFTQGFLLRFTILLDVLRCSLQQRLLLIFWCIQWWLCFLHISSSLVPQLQMLSPLLTSCSFYQWYLLSSMKLILFCNCNYCFLFWLFRSRSTTKRIFMFVRSFFFLLLSFAASRAF